MKKVIKKTVVIGGEGRQNMIAETQAASFVDSLSPIEIENPIIAKPVKATVLKKLRVAAYCRVSTLLEEQELSYATQSSYYEETINADPNMELVGVYGDPGSSGLRMEEREELQRLLRDCEAGKVDAVYTKSVSRLARNAIDCQKIVDRLHELGIYVYFEKEEIRSDDPQLSLVFKFMASIAQEESNSQSQSIKLVVDHNAAMGKPAYKCCYGYRKAQSLSKKPLPQSERHNWVIDEEEAETVRLMFSMILEGFTTYQVAKRLTALEQEKGSDFEWKSCKIPWMLKNVAYKGDIQTHKTVVKDYLDGRAEPNDGHRDSYYLKGHHEPIISEEDFDAVQRIIGERGRVWKEKRA